MEESLATTSYFTRDAKKYIDENKYGYQIQMHDLIQYAVCLIKRYNDIRCRIFVWNLM